MGLPRQLGCWGGTWDPLWLPSIVHRFIRVDHKKCCDLGSGVGFSVSETPVGERKLTLK